MVETSKIIVYPYSQFTNTITLYYRKTMDLGKLFFLSFLGYSTLALHDVSQIHDHKIIRVITYAGYGLVLFPYLYIYIICSPSPELNITFRILLPVLLVVFVILLIYSVLIEIPINIYRNKTNRNNENSVYTLGTYSISRHPGFLWLTAVNAITALIFLKWEIVLLMALLTLCNLILILLEDIFIFPKIFTGYAEYKKNVPFFFRFLGKR